ncbi:MAG: CHC2 zinc finger domain-containing protein [Candidatus Moraniibacteriota bacterium]
MNIKNEFQDDEDDEYFFIQERLWRNSLPKPTPKELLEIFPEIREIIPKKITESKRDIKEKKQEIKDRLKRLYALKTDEFSEWFGEKLINMSMMPELTKLEQNLFKLNHLKHLIYPTRQTNANYKFKEKIEVAKKFPIAELARSKLDLRQTGQNFTCLCPYHNESRNSFYLYAESNRYYCFACNQAGDVINLTMTLYGLDFKNAVEMLQN